MSFIRSWRWGQFVWTNLSIVLFVKSSFFFLNERNVFISLTFHGTSKSTLGPENGSTARIPILTPRQARLRLYWFCQPLFALQKTRTTTVSLEVRKNQHKYVIGPKGSNITDILEKTQVSVEMPSSSSPSETITLRGEQDQLGPAISMVYAKVGWPYPVEMFAKVSGHILHEGNVGGYESTGLMKK